jgi:hypothetical protein
VAKGTTGLGCDAQSVYEVVVKVSLQECDDLGKNHPVHQTGTTRGRLCIDYLLKLVVVCFKNFT